MEENVTLNLTGDGSAEYGSSNDWQMSVGGTNCNTVTGTDCQIAITAGQTSVSDDVVITVRDDGGGEPAESVVLSIMVDSSSTQFVQAGNPLTLNITEDPPLPTVSLNHSGSDRTLAINEDIIATLTLSEMLSEDVTVNLVPSGTSNYGLAGDWNIHTAVPSDTGIIRLCGDPCEITFTAGQTSADVHFAANANVGATAGAYIQIPTVAQSIVQVGSSSRLDFTIGEAPPPLPYVSMSADTTSITEGNTATLTLTLNEVLEEDATFNLIGSGSAEYGTDKDWNLSFGGTNCNMASESNPCQVTILGGETTAEVTVEANTDSTNEGDETFTVSVGIDPELTHLVQDNPSSLMFTILPIQHTIFFSGGRFHFETAITDVIYESAGGSATATLNISPTPTEPVNIPLLVVTGGYASYSDRINVSGATLRGVPSTNNLLISVPANPGTITLSITAAEDGNNNPNTATFRIERSLPAGTLPRNYTIGKVSTWQVRIEE